MKYIVSVLLLCIGLQTVSAQEVYNSSGRSEHAKKKDKRKKGFDASKIIVGGGATLGFGSVPGGSVLDLGISPIIGYHITNHIMAGVGIGYEYLKTVQYLYNPTIADYQAYPAKASIISPNAWARAIIWKHLFASAIFEYDIMHYSEYNYDTYSNITTDKFNVNVPCLLIGPGYQSNVTGRLSVSIEVLYDVLQNPNSQYYGTITPRVSVFLGF